MKKLGFGCMRLPMAGEQVDYEEFGAMIRQFLDAGFCYFDTAHPYIGEQSEIAVRECLTKRYPRDAYLLTDKLSSSYIHEPEDLRPFFENQLECCGVEYFDYYLIHAVGQKNYPLFQHCRAFEQAQELKAEGKIRHVGFSFHDSPEFLEQVLQEHPEVEVVQLQFNYLDYDDPKVQSIGCYEVCRRYGKQVLVMEPVKGGVLADLPEEGRAVLDALGGGSYASYALRYAASFPNVIMVLSGMSDQAQMADNVRFMKDFRPLSQEEFAALDRVREIIRSKPQIACTACKYCLEGCPQAIPIPDLFRVFNRKMRAAGMDAAAAYEKAVAGKGRAEDCIRCGKCEKICPQHLPVRDLLGQCVKLAKDSK